MAQRTAKEFASKEIMPIIEECFEKNIFPVSIRHLLRKPKITLRISCDEFKAAKNKKFNFICKF